MTSMPAEPGLSLAGESADNLQSMTPWLDRRKTGLIPLNR